MAQKCSLSKKQVAEIFQKLSIPERQEIHHWVEEQSKRHPDIFKPGKPGGDLLALIPERWQILSLDTGRYCNFKWTETLCRVVPALESQEQLFRLSTQILRQVAVPLSLLFSRFERVPFAQVFAVDCPLSWLEDFVRSQVRQAELERDATNAEQEEVARLKAIWQSHTITMDLYRTFTHAVLKLRGEVDLPATIFYSIPDKNFVVCLFRHPEILRDDFHTEIPGFRGKHFLMWEMAEHPSTVDAPEVLCERPGCSAVGGAPPDAILRTYRTHQGPKEKRRGQELKEAARRVWRERFEDKMAFEIEATTEQKLQENPGLSGSEMGDLKQAIADGIYEKYEALMGAEELILKQEIQAKETVNLKTCGRCKAASYCTRECQTADWSRHKHVCSAPPF